MAETPRRAARGYTVAPSYDGGRVARSPERRGAKTSEESNILDTRTKGTIVAIFTPPWWVDIAAAKNGSILQVHHPEHGWLAFVFPPEHATLPGVTLIKHSALCDYFAGTLPPSTVSVN